MGRTDQVHLQMDFFSSKSFGTQSTSGLVSWIPDVETVYTERQL